MVQMFRSGPKDGLIQKPGPTNEIQIFPENGELYFSYENIGAPLAPLVVISIDIRLISGSSPQTVTMYHSSGPTDNWNSLGFRQITDTFADEGTPNDPDDEHSTVNFIQGWTAISDIGTNKIKIDVGDQTNCIIALRGIWVGAVNGFVDIVQLFDPDSNNEFEYLIPLGPHARFDVQWAYLSDDREYNPNDPVADDRLRVYVDDHQIQSSTGNWGLVPFYEYDDSVLKVKTYEDEVSDYFARGQLHRVRVKYDGSATDAFLRTFHLSHLWANVELDWIDEIDVSARIDTVHIFNYFKEFTHGRLNIDTSDGASIDSGGQDEFWNPTEVRDCNASYEHKGDRSWVWMVVVPNTESGNGWKMLSHPSEKNGWKKWVQIVVNYNGQYPTATTVHEFGHVAHCHEGRRMAVDHNIGEDCGNFACAFGPVFAWSGNIFCNFHWFQTWYNINFDRAGNPVDFDNLSWNWDYDWWLL